MDDASPLADDLGEMSSQSVHESPSPASIAGIDEQALLDAQARLALAVAAIDGAAEALVEAGLEPADCAPIERSTVPVRTSDVAQLRCCARFCRSVAASVASGSRQTQRGSEPSRNRGVLVPRPAPTSRTEPRM